jgi:NTP pyrophosphatase (non-canonical NTP hydrolase)
MRQDTENFISGVILELERARRKFPEQDRFVTLAALTEEVGELAQAVLHLKFEPKKGKTYGHVLSEAQQVAVMAIRIALDCGLK